MRSDCGKWCCLRGLNYDFLDVSAGRRKLWVVVFKAHSSVGPMRCPFCHVPATAFKACRRHSIHRNYCKFKRHKHLQGRRCGTLMHRIIMHYSQRAQVALKLWWCSDYHDKHVFRWSLICVVAVPLQFCFLRPCLCMVGAKDTVAKSHFCWSHDQKCQI